MLYVVKLCRIKAIMSKKVIIEPGCITCGLCEFIAPEVFEVTDISHVIPGACTTANDSAIQESVERCPVQVITYTEG